VLRLSRVGVGAEEKALAFPSSTWDNIATSHGSGRSGMDCMLRWRNFLKPSLKRQGNAEALPWSKEEDQKLQRVAQEHSHRNVRSCINVSHQGLALTSECNPRLHRTVPLTAGPLQASYTRCVCVRCLELCTIPPLVLPSSSSACTVFDSCLFCHSPRSSKKHKD